MKTYLSLRPLLLILFSFAACDQVTTYSYCPNGLEITGPIPIGIAAPTKMTDSEEPIIATKTYSFNFLMLPIRIRWNLQKGFFIDLSGSTEILATEIGTFSEEDVISTPGTVHGVSVTKSDFLVALIDKKKNTKQLFKITGYSRLKVVTSGETTIDAQAGFVQIDVTDARVKEISFIDNAKGALANPTNELIHFKFIIKGILGSSAYTCEIPPRTYRYIKFDFPGMNIAKGIFIEVENNSSGDNSYEQVKKQLIAGESLVVYKTNDNKLSLKKMRQPSTLSNSP